MIELDNVTKDLAENAAKLIKQLNSQEAGATSRNIRRQSVHLKTDEELRRCLFPPDFVRQRQVVQLRSQCPPARQVLVHKREEVVVMASDNQMNQFM